MFPKLATTPLQSVSTKVSRLLAVSFMQTGANAVHSCDLIQPLQSKGSDSQLVISALVKNSKYAKLFGLQLLFKAIFLEGENAQGLFYNFCSDSLHQYFMPTAGGFTLCNLCWGLTPPPFFVHELQRDHYLHKFVYCPKLSYE